MHLRRLLTHSLVSLNTNHPARVPTYAHANYGDLHRGYYFSAGAEGRANQYRSHD